MAKNWLPEELINVWLVVREFGTVSREAHNRIFSLLINMVFMLCGCGVGYSLSLSAQDKVLDSIISFCGIIIGFVITAMLFSGRNPAADKLRYEQAKVYALKTKYILLSQTQTLIAFLFCVGFCLLTIMIKNSRVNLLDSLLLFSLAMGYFSLGVYRTIFLPFQIYDVHSFALDSLVLEKEEQAKDKVKNIMDGFKEVQ
ncbi:hypothetical protein KUT41_27050 [Pseudomonas aeruginosa]|uniref:hypothetical protein n=1 Tax=Pseudomonas TaxID=286 RepID=UPI000B0244A2|nr:MULTISPECIES: hypothetical protein [Pseudomonas]MBG6753955.1 hypothetical protein [Pseudomonas aeruginosa]MBG6841147.1 hypothetical protein [Pseudomonas aeruginosa]MBG7017992.1 hypothetical protein [Pseudomonas aeruginosa]MBI8816076.1 hypothetical protein [Pseudomonas aeruginosa]MBV5638685.1 hypothetical protein [Pseudomonas aeruginosa]